MRACRNRRVAILVLLLALGGLAAPAAADPATPPADSPRGEAAPDPDLDALLDPAFDDAFEQELARSSDMQSRDPFEEANRKVFDFNVGVLDYVFDPIMYGYRLAVPAPARRGLRRVFLNLDSPRILINDLLQLRFKDAGKTLGRFILNTTVGWGGLFDVGEAAGWERHESDFGQTLGRMGVESGPYLVVPVFGPTTVRDGFGSIVDLAFQPLAYILGPADLILQVYIGSGNGLTALDAQRDKIQALEDSSVDFYAAMRSAYLQSRRAAIAEARGTGDPAEEPEAVEVVAEPPGGDESVSPRAAASP